jgi:hypothetical protein
MTASGSWRAGFYHYHDFDTHFLMSNKQQSQIMVRYKIEYWKVDTRSKHPFIQTL